MGKAGDMRHAGRLIALRSVQRAIAGVGVSMQKATEPCERGRKILDQLELQLEELETEIAEAKARAATGEGEKTVRKPFPDHLPRERVVLPSPTACPCCGGKLVKLGETSSETLESIPRTYKVIQTVREKFACRSCESITEPPAPFHPIPRGRAGAHLLADILHGKFCEHQPLNRQSESFARDGLDLSVSTLAEPGPWERSYAPRMSPRPSSCRPPRR
jgi:transposase